MLSVIQRKAGKIARKAAQVYRQQKSVGRTVTYVARYLALRAPSVLRRSVSARKSAVEMRAQRHNRESVVLAIGLGGGIGDNIVAARYLRDLRASTEPFEFDVFSPSVAVARWIFASVPGFGRCYYDTLFDGAGENHDLLLHISSFLRVKSRHDGTGEGKPGRGLRECVARIEAFNSEASVMIERHPRMDGFLAQKLQFANITRATSLHSMSGITYGGDRFPLQTESDIVAASGLAGRPYITVHNGFDASEIISGAMATKCYPHFGKVIDLLRRELAGVVFVQIGARTSVPLPEADLDLIGKTDLPQASALIKGAVCHLDNESGMVHIASCFGVPCCVVFGPTPADFFGYAGNSNMRPKVCGGCWWITDDWMGRCPRNFPEPICTYTQPPEEVAQATIALLGARRPP